MDRFLFYTFNVMKTKEKKKVCFIIVTTNAEMNHVLKNIY